MRIALLQRTSIAALWACILAFSAASSAAPKTMVVEGVLNATGGGAVADGDYIVTFTLYNVKTGGTAVWKEGPLVTGVLGGRFQHVLGSATPFEPALLDKLQQGWLGLTVGKEPELARTPLHSVAWAMRAAAAADLACSGCVKDDHLAAGAVSANKVGFPYAGAKTKGGPANSALDLQCTGCVSVAELKIDGDLDLGGNALKAKKVTAGDVAAGTVSATSYVGDGSKLSGIKTPAGSCKIKGQVVKGIKADGTLDCIAAMDPQGFPPDVIDEVSNSLIHNQFVDETAGKKMPIADNNPTGSSDTLVFPDIGIAQKLEVLVDLSNSDLATVTVTLFDPNNVKYILYSKAGPGKVLKTTYPTLTKPVSGDLTTWVGKNPKGKWRLQVVDVGFVNNGVDGALNAWSVRIQTLSNQKIEIKGKLIVDEDLSVKKSATIDGDLTVKGTINGLVNQSGWVFHDWGTKQCPTGTTKLYDGVAFSGHYSHQGAGDMLCMVPSQPGPSSGTSSSDLLYPVSTDHMHGTSMTMQRLVYCARCYTPDKGPCFEMFGSETCPTGFQAMYQGFSVGGHYQHANPLQRVCLDRQKYDTSTSHSDGARMYHTRMHAGTPGPYGGKYPTGRTVRCALCCRK